jgi:hypothetical protein
MKLWAIFGQKDVFFISVRKSLWYLALANLDNIRRKKDEKSEKKLPKRNFLLAVC